MNEVLKNVLGSMNLLEKDIREHKFLTDDVELPLRMAQINVVNATADDATMTTYIKALMRVSFHLGQFHMAMDALAGDKLSSRTNKNRDLFRTWRESALELEDALQEIVG